MKAANSARVTGYFPIANGSEIVTTCCGCSCPTLRLTMASLVQGKKRSKREARADTDSISCVPSAGDEPILNLPEGTTTILGHSEQSRKDWPALTAFISADPCDAHPVHMIKATIRAAIRSLSKMLTSRTFSDSTSGTNHLLSTLPGCF